MKFIWKKVWTAVNWINPTKYLKQVTAERWWGKTW